MEELFSLILKYDNWIRFFHIAGAIIAVGSVITADIILLWLKFKPREAETVAKITPLISLQVWGGLIILSLSGLLMFLPRAGLETNPIFQLKILLVLVVFLNGIFLNVWITPKFKELAPEWSKNTTKVKKFTIIAGISSVISFLGWWGIVILMNVFY